MSAALETASQYQWQDGARASLPSLHPRPVPLQDGLGDSAWFLAHPTLCTLAGEHVIAHVCVVCTPPQARWECYCLHMHTHPA